MVHEQPVISALVKVVPEPIVPEAYHARAYRAGLSTVPDPKGQRKRDTTQVVSLVCILKGLLSRGGHPGIQGR